MSLTEIRHILVDVARVPQARVHFRARLDPPKYLPDDREIIASAEAYTDAAGLVRLWLTPSSQVGGAQYRVKYQNVTRLVTVPDTGPADLSGQTVVVLVFDDGTVLVPGTVALDDGTVLVPGTAVVDDGEVF